MTNTESVSGEVPQNEQLVVRVVVFGAPQVVEGFVLWLYRAGYAEVYEWSKPMPAPTPGEVMRILRRRVPR